MSSDVIGVTCQTCCRLLKKNNIRDFCERPTNRAQQPCQPVCFEIVLKPSSHAEIQVEVDSFYVCFVCAFASDVTCSAAAEQRWSSLVMVSESDFNPPASPWRSTTSLFFTLQSLNKHSAKSSALVLVKHRFSNEFTMIYTRFSVHQKMQFNCRSNEYLRPLAAGDGSAQYRELRRNILMSDNLVLTGALTLFIRVSRMPRIHVDLRWRQHLLLCAWRNWGQWINDL